MSMRILPTQLAELAIIGRHLDAMTAELIKSREGQEWGYGDGLWTELSKITVTTDSDITYQLGTFIQGDFSWEFTQEEIK